MSQILITELGKVCKIINGRSYKKDELLDDGKYVVLRVGNLFTNKHWYYSNLDLEENKYCENGDLIYAWSASFGPRVWVGEKVIYHYHIWKMIPDSLILNKTFLYNFLLWDTEKIKSEQGVGTTMIHVTKGSMEARKIIIPSLYKQKEIVKILDKTFETLERAKVNIEKNLQNTKELFDSRLTEIFSKKGEGWEEKKLEDLSSEKKAIVSGPFGSNLKVVDYRESGVPILRLQNVGKGDFIEKAIKYIDKEKAEELKSHSYVVGDIVLAKLGIPIGKTCIIPDSFEDGIILADIVRIRPDKEIVNYQYLEYFLNTSLSVSQLTKQISGATRPRVNLSNVRAITVPITSLDEQNKIVEEINILSTNTKLLEQKYQQKLENLEELKKSILEKAFSGELLK